MRKLILEYKVMTFRADESTERGFEAAKNYLIGREIALDQRIRSENKLREIIDKFGPVIESYPTWHPLVTHHDQRLSETFPSVQCGYKGIDHIVTFVNAFLACPYGESDKEKLLESVERLPSHSAAEIVAEPLDVQFYHPDAKPVLIKCFWNMRIEDKGMIPASIALPLILQKEVPSWEWSEVSENWETMRPYLLGCPHGSRSSLFVSQHTALYIKKMWKLFIETEMFGPARDKR